MATQKKKTGTAATAIRPVVGSDPLPAASAAAPATEAEAVARLSIPLTADGGSIQWDRMRPRTKDQLRTLLASSDTAANLGAPVPGADAGAAVDPAIVGMLYGSLGMLMVSAARAKGYTAEQANVLIFTPEEKAALQDPTAKVLSKYAGSMGKYQDEITLCVTLGMVLTGKLSNLRKAATVIEMVPKNDSEPEGAAS